MHESAQKGTMTQKVCKKYDNILKSIAVMPLLGNGRLRHVESFWGGFLRAQKLPDGGKKPRNLLFQGELLKILHQGEGRRRTIRKEG